MLTSNGEKIDRFRTERVEALHKAFFANIFKAHIFLYDTNVVKVPD